MKKKGFLIVQNLEILLKGVYLNILKAKRTRPKRGESKKKSKKKVSTFLERIKLERKDFQVICIPYLLYLKRLFFYKSL